MSIHTDIATVGRGAAGLFCALKLPADRQITVITKEEADRSDSFLAQGGICVLKDESDYDSYFEDTMKAGHYENRKESVEIMIRSSTGFWAIRSKSFWAAMRPIFAASTRMVVNSGSTMRLM